MKRERNLIFLSLISLAVIAWVALFLPSMSSMNSLTTDALLFLATWVVMMVAMMFPTAAPMILTFTKVHQSKREKGQPYIPTWIFVAGYLIVWSIFGIVVYILALFTYDFTKSSEWLMANAAPLGGSIFVIAGLYQLSPLKRSCLSKCKSPLDFILGSWRGGYGGALRMGIEHGLYCLGCCWLLFVILFPLGIMNIPAMAIITALIFAEKTLHIKNLGYLSAAIMILYGIFVVLVPAALPTMIV